MRTIHPEPSVDLRRLNDVKPFTVLFAIVTLLGAACGEEPPARRANRSASPTPSASSLPKDQLYQGTGLVLDEAKGKGPIFCLGGVEESAPPKCGGPKLRGWSWAGLDFDESGGTRWGTLTLRGTYHDGVFTVKGEPEEPEAHVDDGDDAITAPCPQPADGWEIPDPERTREEDRLAATRAAEAQPDYAGAWIDYIAQPTDEEEMQPWGENIVLVLAFTGDAERHEAEAREHWGGALCIWIHDRTEAELASIQRDLDEPWIAEMGIETTFSDRDITIGTVMIGVIVSTPEFEAELARRYGEGVVEVRPALHPVD